MSLLVAVLLPDLLGTYGDGGNGVVLVRRAAWRGIDAQLVEVPSGTPVPEADIFCLGGGEDGPQVRAAAILGEDGTLARAHDAGAVVLAVCAGFQIAGASFPAADGRLHDGLGLLDVTTAKGAGPRAVGEVVVEPAAPGIGRLSGFENHGGVTVLGPTARPLGTVVAGIGNGGGDRSEGARADRIVGTYLHGPVLARNPALADLLLGWALGRALEPLDDREEEALRAERLAAASRRRGTAGWTAAWQRSAKWLAGRRAPDSPPDGANDTADGPSDGANDTADGPPGAQVGGRTSPGRS